MARPPNSCQFAGQPAARNKAVPYLFAWQDTKEARPPRSSAIAVVNDLERHVSQDLLSAFHQYEIEVLKWSEREDKAEPLTA